MNKDAPPEVDRGPKPPPQLPLARIDHAAHVESMFREHNESLLRFLRARLRSTEAAKEVAREAYVQMLRLDNPETASFVQVHLFRLAAEIATERLKSGVSHPELNLPTQYLPEQLVKVSEALDRLPPRCRRAFILVRFENMDFDAAGAQMGLHPRKVRRFVQRAFASCQRALGRD